MLRAIGSHCSTEWRCEKPHSLTLTQSPVYLFILWISFLSSSHLNLLFPQYFMFPAHSNHSSLLFTPSLLIHLSLSISITPPHTHTHLHYPLHMSVYHDAPFCLLTLSPSFCSLSLHPLLQKHFSLFIPLPASSFSPYRCSAITLHEHMHRWKRATGIYTISFISVHSLLSSTFMNFYESFLE